MFAMTIIDSDAFLDMPLSAQALYFHLCMRADDDGFLNNPKKIQRVIGASEKDLEQLVERRFLIAFPSGVVVIKHWRMHNSIRKDRYKETVYTEEKSRLKFKDNGSYTEGGQVGDDMDTVKNQSDNHLTTTWQPNDNHLEPQVRLGKVRLGKDRVNTNTCSELPQKSESIEAEEQPSSPVYCTIITNRKEEYPITEDMVELWEESFPAVDVKQQLLSMKSWSVSNPKKRKTKNGMLAFVNNWLSKEQNRHTAPVIKTGQGKPSQYTIGNEDRWDSYKEVQAK
jgi:hypothetical protein